MDTSNKTEVVQEAIEVERFSDHEKTNEVNCLKVKTHFLVFLLILGLI